MSQPLPEFGTTIAERYQRAMVPLLFQPYAEQLASLVAARPDAHLRTVDVLEVAAGTGVLSRAVARALPGARVVATDLAEPMLERAAQEEVPPNLSYQQADALALPFPDSSFDLVVSQFGVMFFPDKVQAFREARRVLRHSAELVFLTWDSLAHNETIATVFDALDGRLHAGISLWGCGGPHSYYDPHRITADVGSAGLRLDTLAPLPLPSGPVTARQVAEAICLGSPLRQLIEEDPGLSHPEAVDLAEQAVAQRHGTGTFRASLQALLVSATNTGD